MCFSATEMETGHKKATEGCFLRWCLRRARFPQLLSTAVVIGNAPIPLKPLDAWPLGGAFEEADKGSSGS